MDHQPPPSAPELPPAPPPAEPGPPGWNGKTNGFAIASLSVAGPPEEGDWPNERGVLCLAFSLRDTTGSVRR